jgi:hypothetical protein
MKIETYLNAMEFAQHQYFYWYVHNPEIAIRRDRQYRAFRARILRMFEEKDIADGRLELLRRFEAMLSWCPFCAGIEPSTGGGIEHLEGCELAEELGDD